MSDARRRAIGDRRALLARLLVADALAPRGRGPLARLPQMAVRAPAVPPAPNAGATPTPHPDAESEPSRQP